MIEDTVNGILQTQYWGNTVKEYLIALGVFIFSYAVIYFLEKVLIRRVHKFLKINKSHLDDLIADAIDATRWWFFVFVSLFIASRFLELGPKLGQYSHTATVTILLLQGAVWGKTLIESFLKRYRETRLETDAASVTTVAVLGFMGKLALYSLVLLLILENFGIDVTALIAGLGVGGVAIALASQGVLGDLFASLAIALDKPFAIGDFIIVGDFLGSIQSIGIKTTRLKSLGGEQICIPNSDLMNSRIRNYKRMEERRILFGLGVVYQTSSEKLEKIPRLIQEAVEKQEKTRFDRAHFKNFGDSSLNFEVVYYVLSSDYNVYMDIQQAINFEIFTRFEQEGIEFAYPTQTLYMEPAEVAVKNLPV